MVPNYIYYRGVRSVCVEKFSYNADGTIPKVSATKAGPPQIGTFNPYETVQAETMNFESGVEIGVCGEGGVQVDSIHNNDYIKVKGVDFLEGAKSFDARVASGASGGKIEIRLDSQTGTLVGTCEVTGTGGWQTWATKTCTVSGADGKHDLFLKFTGGSGFLFNFNWWKFTPVAVGAEVKTGKKLSGENTLLIRKSSAGVPVLEIGFSRQAMRKEVAVQLFGVNGQLTATLYTGVVSSTNLTIPLGRTMKHAGGYVVRVALQHSVLLTKEITVE